MAEPLSSRWVGLGYGSAALVGLLTATGGALSLIYSPTRQHAQAKFRPAIESEPWSYVASVHYWASAALLISLVLAVLWLFLAGFRSRAKVFWPRALLMLMAAYGLQVTSNPLRMDAHDIQTVNVEASIAQRVPILGSQLKAAMLQGSQFSDATSKFWYLASCALAAVLTVLTIGFTIKLRRSSGAKLDWFDYLIALTVVAAPMVCAALLSPAGGSLYTEEDVKGFTASPGWYTLPLHLTMVAFSSLSPSVGWVGSALLPGLAAILAFAAPIWAIGLSPKARAAIVAVPILLLGTLFALSPTIPAPVSGPQPVTRYGQLKVNESKDEVLVLAGWQSYKKRCSGCHGGHAQGGIGPALQEISKTIQDTNWYMGFIRNPRSVRSGSTMPSFGHLSESELKALAEWLRSGAKPK